MTLPPETTITVTVGDLEIVIPRVRWNQITVPSREVERLVSTNTQSLGYTQTSMDMAAAAQEAADGAQSAADGAQSSADGAQGSADAAMAAINALPGQIILWGLFVDRPDPGTGVLPRLYITTDGEPLPETVGRIYLDTGEIWFRV